jgi:hypothetical protein
MALMSVLQLILNTNTTTTPIATVATNFALHLDTHELFLRYIHTSSRLDLPVMTCFNDVFTKPDSLLYTAAVNGVLFFINMHLKTPQSRATCLLVPSPNLACYSEEVKVNPISV